MVTSYFFEAAPHAPNLDEAMLHYFHPLPAVIDQQAFIEVLRILTEMVRRNPSEPGANSGDGKP